MISMDDLREVSSELRCQETDLKEYPSDPEQITARILERVDALLSACTDYNSGVGKSIYVYDRMIKLCAELFRMFNIFKEVFYD